eukprot:tig00000133_g7672.t1
MIQPGIGPNLIVFRDTILNPTSDLLQVYDGGDPFSVLLLETRGPAVPERLLARTAIFIAFTCNVSAVNASAVAGGSWGFSLSWEGAPDSNILVMTDFSVEGVISSSVQLMGLSALANQRLELTNVDYMYTYNGSNAAVITLPPPSFFRTTFEVLLGGGPAQSSGMLGGKLPSGGRTNVNIEGGEGFSFSLGNPAAANPDSESSADFRGELGANDGLALVLVTHLSNEFMYDKSVEPEYAPAIGLRFRGRWIALVPDSSLRDRILFRTFSVTVRPTGTASLGALVSVEKNDEVILRDVLIPDYLVSAEKRYVNPTWRAYLAARMYSGFDQMYGKMLIHADNHFVRQLSILRIGAIESATPRYGPREGGNIVTIRGTALAHISGEDITQVQLSGVEVARILSKTNTVIIVEAGAYTQQGESEDWTTILISSRFFGKSVLLGGYLYNPVMMIGAIQPRDGPRNGTIPGSFVQITVFNLGSDRDVVKAWFGDNEAVILDGENGQTDNYIRVATPPNIPGLVPVKIFSVSRGHAVLVDSYMYNEAPAITGFGPYAVPRGPVWGGHSFTIFGRRLSDIGDTADLEAVRICNETLPGESYEYKPDGSVVVTTPVQVLPRPSGLCDVETCSLRYGCAVAPMAYSFEMPGVVDRLSPAYGSSLAGQRLTVFGNSLVDPARNLSDFACPPGRPGSSFCRPVVFTNDVATLAVDVALIEIVSSSQIVVVTPPNIDGVFTLRVQTLSRGPYERLNAFSSVILEGINPAEGPIEGGVHVTVHGRLPVAEEFAISFCGAPLRIVAKEFDETDSLTHVVGVTPDARACSTGPVPLGLVFDGVQVNLDRAPHFLLMGIDSVEPQYGSVHGGDLVTISGTGFALGLADVQWVRVAGVLVDPEDLVACQVGADNQTTLLVFTGSAFGIVGSGRGDVVVSSATFGVSTLRGGFTYSGLDRVTCFPSDYAGPLTATAALANATADGCDGPLSGGTFMLLWGSHLLHGPTQAIQVFVDAAPAHVFGWSEANRTTLHALSNVAPVPTDRIVVFVVQTGLHGDTGAFPIVVASLSSAGPRIEMSRPPVEFTYWQPLVPALLPSGGFGSSALCRWSGNGGRSAMDGCDCGAGCYDPDCGAMSDAVASGAEGLYPDGTPAYCPLRAPSTAEAATAFFVGSKSVEAPGAATAAPFGSYRSPAKSLDAAFEAFQKQRNGSVQIVLMPGRLVALPVVDGSKDGTNANVTFRMPADLPAGSNVTWRGLSGARYSVVDSAGRGRVVSVDLGDFDGTFVVRDLSFANGRSGDREREGGSLLVFSSAAVGRATVLLERVNFTNCTLAPASAAAAGGGGGGALAVRNVAKLVVRDSTFAGNSFVADAPPADGDALPAAGGGSLYAARVARVRIERTSFSGDRSALHGGSIAIFNAADVELISVNVTGSAAALGSGGCVFVSGVTRSLTISASSFAGCSSGAGAALDVSGSDAGGGGGGGGGLQATIESTAFEGYAGAGLALANARDVTLSALSFDSASPAAAGCVSIPSLAASLAASGSNFSRCVAAPLRGPSAAAFAVTTAALSTGTGRGPHLSFDRLRFVDAGGPLAAWGPARLALARSSFESSPAAASHGGCLAVRGLAAPAGSVAVSATNFSRCVHAEAAAAAAGSGSGSVAAVLVEGAAPGAASVEFERVRLDEPGGPLEVTLAANVTLAAVSVSSKAADTGAAGGLLLRPLARRLALRDVNCTRCLARDRAGPHSYPFAAPGALFAAGVEEGEAALAALGSSESPFSRPRAPLTFLRLAEVEIEGLRLESCAGGAASLHALGSATLRAVLVQNAEGDALAAGGLAVSNIAGPFAASDVTLLGASSEAAAASRGALVVEGAVGARAGAVSLDKLRVEGNVVSAKAGLFSLRGALGGAGVAVTRAASLSIRASRFARNRALSPGAGGGSLLASDVSGEVRLDGCSFEGDEAAGDGGSVALVAVGGASLREVSVRGSRAVGGHGGCLAVRDLAGPLTAGSLDLSSCNATGAPFSGGGAGGCLFLLGSAVNADSSAALTGTRFSACSSAASAEAPGHAGGGAAFIADLAAASLEDSEFEGNVDRGQAFKEVAVPRTEGGGALLAVGVQRLLVARSRFASNAALVKGGAISAVQVSDAAIRFCAFEGNAADNGGAAFPSFGGGGAVSFEGSEGLSSSLLIQNSTFVKNLETQSGGGQMRGGGALWAEKASSLTVRGSAFEGNAGQRGGALSVGARALVVEESEFAANGWPAADEAGRATDGGAIDARLSGPAASLLARSSFAENSAAKGGAVHIETDGMDPAPVHMEGVSFVGNAASASGGALVVSQVDLTATGITFRGNSAGQAGGALLVDAEKRCTIRFASSSFVRNDAQEGGAVALLSSTAAAHLEITSASFTLNEAKNNGGAITQENGELLVRACSFESNRALAAGGAVYMSSNVGWARFEDSSMTANTATENGGVLAALVRASPALVNCVLRRNVAKANGGAVWCMKSSACALAASSIESGSADRGGAIYVDQDASVLLKDVSLSRNVAEMAGGAILARTRARLTMHGGSISGNQAARGGGILLDDDSSARINGTAIALNLAASRGKEARPDGTGGGICVASNSSCTLLGGTLVTSNRADGGAGVAVLDTARFTAGAEDIVANNRRALLQAAAGNANATAVPATVVIIGSNVATGNGAGLLQSGGVVRLLRGVQLAENTAGGRGGGLFYESGTIDLKGALITKNQATDGGGAYMRPTSCSAINIKGLSVQDNVATGGGGDDACARAFFVDAKDPAACAPFAALASGASEYFTSLDGNTGRFGGGIAGVPAAIVLFGPRNATPPHNETTPASRMPLYYKVEVRDSYNQLVRTATGTVVVVSALELGNASVAGSAQVVTFEGVAEFKDVQVIARPGTTAAIVFKATFPDGTVLSATSSLALRQCMRGEVLEENRAYCPTCSYCKLCPSGTYSLEDSDFRGKECLACPTGASCVSGGSDVRPLKNFWHSPYDPHRFIQCINEACLVDYGAPARPPARPSTSAARLHARC